MAPGDIFCETFRWSGAHHGWRVPLASQSPIDQVRSGDFLSGDFLVCQMLPAR